MEEIVIARMVRGLKQPPQPGAVAACAGDEVGESRQLGEVWGIGDGGGERGIVGFEVG